MQDSKNNDTFLQRILTNALRTRSCQSQVSHPAFGLCARFLRISALKHLARRHRSCHRVIQTGDFLQDQVPKIHTRKQQINVKLKEKINHETEILLVSKTLPMRSFFSFFLRGKPKTQWSNKKIIENSSWYYRRTRAKFPES